MATVTSNPLHPCPPAQPSARQQRTLSRLAAALQFSMTDESRAPNTVFDRLYDEYLPFRLYADFMLGSSTADLSKRFGLSEDWVSERIQVVRWCIEKQVRLNLLAPTN